MGSLAALLLAAGAGAAEEARPAGGGGGVLVFPIRSHWLSAPLAERATMALARALGERGFAARVATADSPLVRRAVAEGWLEEGGPVEEARYALAVAAGAEAVLTGELEESGSRASVRGRLGGAVSRCEVEVEAAAGGGSLEAVATALAEGLAGSVAEVAWAKAGVDGEGRRAGAAARAAAGERALADGDYRGAAVEYEAALLGDPDEPAYLLGAAVAHLAWGRPQGALMRVRRLSSLLPDDPETLVRVGDIALLAGDHSQAQSAFAAARGLAPGDARALEGLARVARARGETELARARYEELIEELRGRGLRFEEPLALAGVLAGQPDDRVRLAGVSSEEMARRVGWAYLRAGATEDGVRALLDYHALEGRPAYTVEEYLWVAAGLDEESERIAGRAEAMLAAAELGMAGRQEKEEEAERLHARSERLATVAERMRAPEALEPAHRYRVLSCNLLNQSNFEALLYYRTGEREQRRRSEVLREHCRGARGIAQELQATLLETLE